MKKPQKNRHKITEIDPNQMEFAFVCQSSNTNQFQASKNDKMLKNTAGESPNECGVFVKAEPQFEMCCNSRAYLRVWLMELENGTWIWSHHLCLPLASSSTPLSTYWVYQSRFAALKAAFQADYNLLLREQNTKAGDRVRVRLLKSLLAWMAAENIKIETSLKAA